MNNLSPIEIIEINASKSSKLLHDFLPAVISWIIIAFVIQSFTQSLGINAKAIIGIIVFAALALILFFAYKQSKTYKLDLGGLTITTKDRSQVIPWEVIESVAKVSLSEGDFMYQVLDKNSNKYTFPTDTNRGRTESFLDSLPQLTTVPAKTTFDNYSARWKNINSPTYKYTSFADRFMNFSYGDPNLK